MNYYLLLFLFLLLLSLNLFFIQKQYYLPFFLVIFSFFLPHPPFSVSPSILLFFSSFLFLFLFSLKRSSILIWRIGSPINKSFGIPLDSPHLPNKQNKPKDLFIGDPI